MIDYTNFNFGGIQSPDDPRDFTPDVLGTGTPSVTPASSSTILFAPVYNQLQEPACGGHGGTTFWQALAKNGETLSPRFVYAMCKKIDGVPDQQGTTGRAIMQVLQKYGVCTDALFPNDTTLPYAEYIDTTKIPPAAFADALNRRIGVYAKLTAHDTQTIKDNIYKNSVVLILGYCGPTWWQNAQGQNTYDASQILPLVPPTTNKSGHFWVDYAFTPTTTTLRNSWGTTWAANGNGYYNDDYAPDIIEAWVAQLPTPPAMPVPTPTTPVTNSQWSIWLTQVSQWVSNIAAWWKNN